MPKLYIMCGLPGAGKSTAAADINAVTVDMDSIRGELYGDPSIQTNPRRVYGIAMARIRATLEAGQNCIFDGTNYTKRRRKCLMKQFDTAEHICVWVSTPLHECLKRNSQRSRVVPVEIIERYAAQFQPPMLNEGFTKIIEIRA